MLKNAPISNRKKRKNLKTIEFKARTNNKEGDPKHPEPPVD